MEPTAKKRRLTDQRDARRVQNTQATKGVKMDDIPNSLLVELFQYFDRAERRDRRSVCKRWILLLKSRSLRSQSHLAIEVPMNFAIKSRPKPPASLWSVRKPVKTLIFYGLGEKTVLSGIEKVADVRLRRVKKGIKTAFKEVTVCVKREARNYFINNNVHFVADVLMQMFPMSTDRHADRAAGKIVLGRLDFSLEQLLSEGTVCLGQLPPLFVMNIRLPGLNSCSIDILGGHKGIDYEGPQCITMYDINGYEEVEKSSEEKFDYLDESDTWVELKLAQKYMPVPSHEQTAEVERQLKKMVKDSSYNSGYDAVLRARMLLAHRYPKEFSAKDILGDELTNKDMVQSLLQKPDVVFLLYWWFIFKQLRDEDPRFDEEC